MCIPCQGMYVRDLVIMGAMGASAAFKIWQLVSVLIIRGPKDIKIR